MCNCENKDEYLCHFIMRANDTHELRLITFPPADNTPEELQYQRSCTFARVHALGFLRGNGDWYRYVSDATYIVKLVSCNKCNKWSASTPHFDGQPHHLVPTGYYVRVSQGVQQHV